MGKLETELNQLNIDKLGTELSHLNIDKYKTELSQLYIWLKLPEKFIVDQIGCDVTLRSFIQWQRMHAWMGLKLSEEFIMENVRLRGLAPVLEDNVGTGPHSTFCLCRMDEGIQHSTFVEWTKAFNIQRSTFVEWTKNAERWAVVGVSTFQMVVS
ncbi:hypothetical protein HELRODRAFT_180568 [Helobdella robusta]|uniref:Uncharacterized protein n=1 Tax=Helobdella robusta TaxID=6412 RepID=T1FG20_HELRO|nr:hypothetical protein HELRODRAFT_180568 [Helobdella robusta]ESN93704.1 hypothetical protein HELRODRAFT_180568 [Helobdella robusta]